MVFTLVRRHFVDVFALHPCPTGRHYLAPSDKLDHKVAKILQVPNATRSRIGRGQYLTPSEHNPVGLLEEALVDVIVSSLPRFLRRYRIMP